MGRTSLSDELPRALPLPAHCGIPRRSRRSRWRAAVLIAVHVAILAHVAQWQLQGRTLTPLEPSEAMQTLELGYLNAGLLLFALATLATLVFGRFFCGWACHLVAYQDLCIWALKKVGMRPRPLRSRVLALVPIGAAFYMFAWPTFARWYAGDAAPTLGLHLTTEDFWATFPGPWIAALTLLVDGALVVYFLGAKGFCTYGCPYGAVFAIAERAAPGRIRVDERCEACGHCTASCSSNVRVHEEVRTYGAVVDPGCMKCLDCVSVCPREALRFGFGRPAVATRARRRRPRWRRAIGWGEELLMAAAFAATLLALRGLYDLVPFLLAIGLAVLSALAALTAWRLVRQREFRLQHHALRQAGRWTRPGLVCAVVIGAWFLFLAHSGWVQWHTWRGERLVHELKESGWDELRAARARVHLESAERLGLTSSSRLHDMLGSLLYRQGELGAATQQFERAVARDPAAHLARFHLAEALALGGRLPEAESQLRRLLAERPEWSAPRIPLAKLLMRRGARAEAEALMRRSGQPLEQH